MSLFRKLATAIRGGTREVAQAVVDANGIRIFEQELVDARNHLEKAKHELTGVMAKRTQAQRELNRLQSEIDEHEGYAAAALNKGDEALALEIAEKIARLEGQRDEQQHILETFAGHVTRLKENIASAERQIKEQERQLSMVKTTDSVQKATASISDTFSQSNSSVLSAKASLDRIKAKQQDREDRLKAAQELQREDSSESLEEKLKAAGIKSADSSASAVLDRIKAKQS